MWSVMDMIPWWGFLTGLAQALGLQLGRRLWAKLTQTGAARGRERTEPFACPGCGSWAWRCECGGSG